MKTNFPTISSWTTQSSLYSNQSSDILQHSQNRPTGGQMVKVLTYDIPDHKIKLKIRHFQVMGKEIQGKLITQAMNGTSVADRCKISFAFLNEFI